MLNGTVSLAGNYKYRRCGILVTDTESTMYLSSPGAPNIDCNVVMAVGIAQTTLPPKEMYCM